jgi:hypothetical protein
MKQNKSKKKLTKRKKKGMFKKVRILSPDQMDFEFSWLAKQ